MLMYAEDDPVLSDTEYSQISWFSNKTPSSLYWLSESKAYALGTKNVIQSN